MFLYNVHKQRPCEATRICRSLRRLGAAVGIICLQEIPKWTAGFLIEKEGYVVLSPSDEAAHMDGFDCGFHGACKPASKSEK